MKFKNINNQGSSFHKRFSKLENSSAMGSTGVGTSSVFSGHTNTGQKSINGKISPSSRKVKSQ
jgi:hypothetical protein